MGKGALAISERELEGQHLAWLIDTSPNARRRSSGNANHPNADSTGSFHGLANSLLNALELSLHAFDAPRRSCSRTASRLTCWSS
jgi:hypothetical protein